MPAKRKITRKTLQTVRDRMTEAFSRMRAETYAMAARPNREVRGSYTPDPTLSAIEAAEAAAGNPWAVLAHGVFRSVCPLTEIICRYRWQWAIAADAVAAHMRLAVEYVNEREAAALQMAAEIAQDAGLLEYMDFI